jgi:phosphate:Na+ symporter
VGAALIFNISSQVVGGLCIFLLGMKHMSEGMQAVAGNRLRRMICAVTDNRLLGLATGAGITALIQSSSVTTVMLVGMVNAGVMTLLQAIGVILGADIGTTITAWIVALKILKYGLPILGVAGFFYLFTRNERVRYISLMVMGIGMVFFGLDLMKHGLQPLREMPEFIEMFSKFAPTNILGVVKCALIGALVTAVVQSSSATVAITITLARTGAIGYDTAVALVLGQNIGTTITAYLASLGASTSAKRVAYAHVLIKTLAVTAMIFVFFPYMGLLRRMTPATMDIAKRIAVAHTLFNVFLVCLFLPFRTPLASLLVRLFPDKPHKEKPRLTFLDVRMLETPVIALEQSANEIARMGTSVSKMLGWCREAVTDADPNNEHNRKLLHREEILDEMQKEIVEFLSHLLASEVPAEGTDEARRQLRYSDEYESISDYIAALLKLNLKLRRQDLSISPEGVEGLLSLHDSVAAYVQLISEAVEQTNTDILTKARTQGNMITRRVKDERIAHLKRIEERGLSPLKSLIFVDMLQSYRKIKDHALNIAEVLAGEK